MENQAKKASLKTMFLTIKKSKSVFFGVVIALLIPILFISGYTFYTDYATFAVDYTAFDAVDVTVESLLDGGALDSFLVATEKALSTYSPSEASATLALKTINFALKLLIIAFAAIYAITVERNQKADATQLVVDSAKRILGMALISVFFIWIYQLAYRMFFSSVLTMLAMQRIADGALAAIPTVITTVALITLLAALVISHLYFAVITICKKRTRALFALSYSRAIMKGKKQVFKLILWVLISFTVPVFVSAIAPFLISVNVYAAIAVCVFSEILFIVLTIFALVYLVPRHSAFEEESDILNKIRQAQMQAFQAAGMRAARKSNEEDKDNQQEDNQQDSTKKDDQKDNDENPVEDKEQ